VVGVGLFALAELVTYPVVGEGFLVVVVVVLLPG
jgi:hypothetical protein